MRAPGFISSAAALLAVLNASNRLLNFGRQHAEDKEAKMAGFHLTFLFTLAQELHRRHYEHR